MGGKTILVDCGGEEYNSAGNVAADYLADLGIDTVDLLVLTHYHADHANGLPSLLRRLEVKEVALPDVERGDSLREAVETQIAEEGATMTYITTHTMYSVGEKESLRLYAPLGSGESNEMGLSVLASAGDYDVLITGDMDSGVERRLVKYGDLPDIELLVVGHHGSRYSTDAVLLETTRPETAAISVGAGNRYGHPAEETLSRLNEYDVTIYRTDLSGTLVFHTKGG
jgi:competence protein ComEC